MNHYQIKFAGLTYHVEPFFDDGELFAVIHRVDGLEQYGPDDLPARLVKTFTPSWQRCLAKCCAKKRRKCDEAR